MRIKMIFSTDWLAGFWSKMILCGEGEREREKRREEERRGEGERESARAHISDRVIFIAFRFLYDIRFRQEPCSSFPRDSTRAWTALLLSRRHRHHVGVAHPAGKKKKDESARPASQPVPATPKEKRDGGKGVGAARGAASWSLTFTLVAFH